MPLLVLSGALAGRCVIGIVRPIGPGKEAAAPGRSLILRVADLVAQMTSNEATSGMDSVCDVAAGDTEVGRSHLIGATANVNEPQRLNENKRQPFSCGQHRIFDRNRLDHRYVAC